MKNENPYGSGTNLEMEPRRIDNIILLPVTHGQANDSPGFMQVLQTADHLLIEGINLPSSHPATIRQGGMEYVAEEQFTQRGLGPNVHMLEKNFDLPGSTAKYGLPVRNSFLFDTYRIVFSVFEQATRSNEAELPAVAKRLQKNLKEGRSYDYPSYVDLPDKDDLIDSVFETILGLRQLKQDTARLTLGIAAIQRVLFSAPIRDAEILFPRIRMYDEKLQGVKAVVVGANHIKPLYTGLQHGHVSAPGTWSEYVNGLHKREKHAIKIFEETFDIGPTVKPWYRRLGTRNH